MKTKKVMAVLCAISLLFGGCAHKSDSYTPMAVNPSEDDDTWDLVESGIAVLENGSVYLELDAETTHFTVKNKKNGQIYDSVPAALPDIISEETSSRLLSEITVCYYAEQTNELYMYSDTDSVQNMSFTVKTDGNAIRVYYSMGEADQLLPALFSEETFEEILNRFTSNALRRRMERAYVLYSAEDKPEDYAEKLKQYPVLAERSLYILSDVLSDTDKEDLIFDLQQVGYTQEEYAAMLASLKLENIKSDTSAGFLIPVEYRLTQDGFTASILSDRIEEASDKFKLHSVDLLEYFAAFADGTDSAFVIPDGAGAMIHLKGKNNMEFSKPFYGDDIATNQATASGMGKPLVLPVYGIQRKAGGLFTIVEDAAETAVLKAYSSGDVTPLNHIYTSFVLRSVDTSGSFSDAGIEQYNLFANKRIAGSPRVRYCLLDTGKASYTDMAQLYREYLQETKGMAVQPPAEPPVYLDYLCMITEEASILGIPYTKKTVLSTVSEIISSVDQLRKEGIRGITVRLRGYGPSGMNNSAYTVFDIDRKVGTAAELKRLSEILRESGGGLYLDADLQFAYDTGNGFKPSRDAARKINRKLAQLEETDLVTGQGARDGNAGYLISPARFSDYTATFLQSLKKSFGDAPLPGLSYGLSGLYLGGDYSPQRSIDRTESRKLLSSALDGVKDSAAMMFDYGNAYILPYASGLLNAPLYNSQLLSEDETIPFFQMVVHGSIPYAGGAENLAKNSRESYLRAVEYGAAPYAVFITREDSLLNYTEWQAKLFSVSDKTQMDAFVQHLRDTDALRRATLNRIMIAHEKLSETLFCTTYEGGYTVYVNYGNEAAVINSTHVPAKGFAASP